MGVLNNAKRKVVFSVTSGGETTTDDEGPLNVRHEPQEPVQAREARPRPPPSPRSSRRRAAPFGATLKLKKGRRARHRYDSERSLFAIAEIDPDEAPEGPNIFEETTSKFQNLLDNEELLDQFLDKEDFADIKKEVPSKNNNDKDLDRDPESSFLRISGHLRQALKKHLPYGMLEHLEEQIVTHFTQNPGQSFEVSDLSSYERLLAHTCSMYNSLVSQSFDKNGVRILKIVNPRMDFEPIDPRLVKYLQMRYNHEK